MFCKSDSSGDILALCRVQHLPSVECLSVCGMQSMAAADSKHIQ